MRFNLCGACWLKVRDGALTWKRSTQGLQSLLSLSCHFRRQPQCAGTADAEAAGAAMGMS